MNDVAPAIHDDSANRVVCWWVMHSPPVGILQRPPQDISEQRYPFGIDRGELVVGLGKLECGRHATGGTGLPGGVRAVVQLVGGGAVGLPVAAPQCGAVVGPHLMRRTITVDVVGGGVPLQ